ncbi:LysR family transcriptional regulator [Pseudomonas sp. NPDC090202]|uniref:LysR family transcriptional regulator n=1 Tax=unclassified Pseudomonas TaxID=196821 RepID=UPI003805356D
MLPSLQTIASRLRLKQLRLLIALDEQGSLHKAAEHISISQSGATKALHEIEAILGMPLFERQTKGMLPNDLGRCVIRYARLIYSDLAHLREEMLGIMQGSGGRLSVGVIMGAMPMMTRAICRLREKQPDLSVELVENTSANLLALLDEGRLDLAICRTSVSQRSDAYEYRMLSQEPLSVVATAAHPLAGQQNLTLAQLADYRWIVYPAQMPMRQTLERELEKAGMEVPRHALETSSTFATFMLLQEDRELLAVIPREVARFGEKFGMLVQLPVMLPALSPAYGIVRRAGSDITPAAQLLIEEVLAQLDDANPAFTPGLA